MKKPTWAVLLLVAAIAAGAARAALGSCSPFGDVPNGFCPFVLELYYLGITAGTSPTTFSPDQPVTRGQAAVFVSKAIDTSIQRSSPRAALGQWWTTQLLFNNSVGSLSSTTIGANPQQVVSDGTDLWVPEGFGQVARVRASDGKLLETWTGAAGAYSAVVAMGHVFISGAGELWMIDPSQPAGNATLAATIPCGSDGRGIVFDGSRIWMAMHGPVGQECVVAVTPGATLPWTVTSAPASATLNGLSGMLFDGSNVWVASFSGLAKLDANGSIVTLVPLPALIPVTPTFDGTNIWLPGGGAGVSVIRASTATLVATLAAPDGTSAAAFDGERVLVTSWKSPSSVSIWKAADLSLIATMRTDVISYGACSDGKNFWLTGLSTPGKLIRY